MFCVKLTADKKTVWDIKRQSRSLIAANNRVLEVTEVRVEIVKISDRRRANIRRDKLVMLAKLVSCGNFQFAVARAAGVAQCKYALFVCGGPGRHRSRFRHWVQH